jgi:archaemetzincin
MDLPKITLISFGDFDNVFLRNLTQKIYNEFLISVQIKEAHLDLSDFYNPMRRQYDANELLHYMERQFSAKDLKTIGLFNVDLFIPIFTYIFGQAFLDGRTGIASAYRLNNECYGIEADPDLLLERFAKEIIHELGHTFGLIHCHVPDCVMRSGTYVEDIDQKNIMFCPTCKANLIK